MTYLELAQRVAQEAGISGTPSTAVGLSIGDHKRIADWVATAWSDIQRLCHDWNWLRASYTFDTVAGTEGYSTTTAGISTRFGRWDQLYMTLYQQSLGVNDTTTVEYLPYEIWRETYKVRPYANARPLYWTIDADRSILFGPKPDAVYTVIGHYFKAPQSLTADADEPEMPSEFHMAIAYKALIKYARFDNAGEIMGEATREYVSMLHELSRTQRPQMTFAGALVA